MKLYLIAATMTAGLASSAWGARLDGAALLPQAQVGLDAARAAALKAHPGKIVAQELEKEDGGSGLRYSFDIRDGHHTYEVGVDAASGAILENAKEGAHPD